MRTPHPSDVPTLINLRALNCTSATFPHWGRLKYSGIGCFIYQGEVFIDPRKRKTKEYIKFSLIEGLTNIKARPMGELREAVRGVLMQLYL